MLPTTHQVPYHQELCTVLTRLLHSWMIRFGRDPEGTVRAPHMTIMSREHERAHK